MPPSALENALRALVDWDRRRVLQLYLSTEVPSSHDLDVDLSGRDLHGVLEEARHQGLVRGDAGGGDGSLVFWLQLHLTVAGLRRVGEWPASGKEALPGPWHSGAWGTIDRLVLADLDRHLPEHRYVFAQTEEGDHSRLAIPGWRYWEAIRRLVEAGLLDGSLKIEGLQDARVTERGREVLFPVRPDPLTEAEGDAALGNYRQAAMTAGVALEGGLQRLAQRHGIPVSRRDAPLKAAELNSELRKAGVYGHSDRAHVEAWLAVRNAAAHPRDEDPSAHVAPMIAGVRGFLERHAV